MSPVWPGASWLDAHGGGRRRYQSQPVAERTAGCVFRNPDEGLSAGALIDRTGLKGAAEGPAVVSPKHANFLVNTGGCSSQDVKNLIARIKEKILLEHGVELREEIRYIPYSVEFE